jgi:hypothetical protein
MMKLAIFALIFAAGVSLVIATGGDFNTIDFVASAPYCYSHRTGGGAFNDDTSGKDKDTVESLEGKDFRCGDIISYLVIVEMKPTVVDPIQNLQMKVSFLSDPTGQSGVGFGNLAGVSINGPTIPVENGNNFRATADAKATQPAGGCLGSYGTDGYAYSNGNEEVIVNSRQLTRPIFTQGATLEAVVTITNLEAGERVIVRVDVFIYCLPGSRPTGNLQGDILWKVSMADWSSISGGQQTVPLLGVGGIQGIDCVAVTTPLVGNDFRANLTTYYPDGGIIYSDFKYSWSYGAYSLVNPGSGTFELHTFETACSFLHSGEYLYAQSECGCESTKIGADQPQLFFNASGTYYDPAFVTMTEPYTGLSVRRYARAGTTQTIRYLYLNAATGAIVRIDWADGRIMIFTNIVAASFTAADFTAPATTCTCRRRTDIAIVIERSATVDTSDLQAAKTFAVNLTRQFEISADHNQIAVMYYGASSTTSLGINAGNDRVNVVNAINAIPCDGSGKNGGCGAGADGDVVVALNAAVQELQSSTRAFTGKVVIFVTDGWANPSGDVTAAIDAARRAGVEVMVVSYLTTMMAIDLDDLTTNPDYLIQRFTLNNLQVLDPIDVSSRVCLINQFPCGAGCCGYCDSACGTCVPVDSCPTVQGCLTASRLVGNCCVNVTTDTCPNRDATCEVGTCNAQTNSCNYTPTCNKPANDLCFDWNCVNGTCVKTPLFSVNQCVVQQCVNNNIVTNRVQCPASDACTTWACDNSTGCFSTPVANPNPPSTGACARDYCDVAQGGWTTETLTVLPNGQPCNPSCTLDCGAQDTACVTNYCIGAPGSYSCSGVATNCTNPGPCYTTTCDPTLGCQTVAMDCDDNNACTVDSCVNGACVHTPVTCASNNLCIPSTCNNQTGACETAEKICSDGVGCTDDTCDPSTGDCIYTPNHVTCNIQDRCHNYFCTPNGCVAEDLPCPDDGLFCTVAVCVAFQGCNNQSLSCNNTVVDKEDCSTVACAEEEGQCVKQDRECALPPSIIVVTGLAAGVIAGIVVGIIAFIACAGGASYAAFQQMGTGGTSAVVNNPLYKGDKKDGLNPLYQAGQ